MKKIAFFLAVWSLTACSKIDPSVMYAGKELATSSKATVLQDYFWFDLRIAGNLEKLVYLM